jgi:hypothetical protein
MLIWIPSFDSLLITKSGNFPLKVFLNDNRSKDFFDAFSEKCVQCLQILRISFWYRI